MNKNNIHNISTKYIRPCNKNSRNNIIKKGEIKEDNLVEKNNIIFIKNNNNSLQSNRSLEKAGTVKNSQIKDDYMKKNINIYCNENKKKKIMNEKMKFLINNITNEENITNGVNIHNINLINSMNNITYYDSCNDNKISNLKKDLIKYPINKYTSLHFYKSSNTTLHSKNNCSLDYNMNNNHKNNIIVNKNKILLDNKNNNSQYNELYKNNNISVKKDSFSELNYKKLNLTFNNFKSINQCNKGNYYSLYNKKEIKNDEYKNLLYMDESEVGDQGQQSQIKNRNNSQNKNIEKINNINKTDFSIFNTFNKSNISIIEKENNGNNFEKQNIKHNIINVNKLDAFKTNNNRIYDDNNIKINVESNYNSINKKNFDNNSNIKNSSNSSSNIYSLISNKNRDNNNKPRLDIDNLNKIKKNINDEKLYKNKSKDNLINSKKQKNSRKSKKTKSEEKCYKKNKTNNEKTKKKRPFSSLLFENNQENNNSKKNVFGNTFVKDINNFNASIDIIKYYYSCLNSLNNTKKFIKNQEKKNISYSNRMDYNNLKEKLNKINRQDKYEKENNINAFEKIEVNKKNYSKNTIPKKNTYKNNINNKSIINTIYTKNEPFNIYDKRTLKRPWVNNGEQINNNDYYSSLSNYKEKKEEEKKLIKDGKIMKKNSAPKQAILNIVYNKKQLNIKKGKNLEDRFLSPDWKDRKINFDNLNIKSNGKNFIENIENEEIIKNILEEELSSNYNDKENDITNDLSEHNHNKNINLNNKTYIMNSPSNTIYKKPCRNVNNNSNLSLNGKDYYNNKLFLCSNKINEKDNYLPNSKKKSNKRQMNIKLNKFIEQKEFSNENNYKMTKKNNININNINYDNEDLIPKIKDNNLIHSINSYKSNKNDLSLLSNKDCNKSKDYMVNNDYFSFTKINQKVPGKKSLTKKYYCYFIDYNQNKEVCFISKIRININDLIINEVPRKKICYYSKKRKIFVKTIPKIEICYFKKDLIKKNISDKKNNKLLNKKYEYNQIEEENNLLLNNDLDFINKKAFEDNNNKFMNHQYSFASINSFEQNNNENYNSYFEISFGKKNKSIFNLNNENIKSSFNNNNENLINKLTSSDKYTEEINQANSNLSENKNKYLNNIIDISPSKTYLNEINKNDSDNYLKKTEKGLKLLEKIASNRISPISSKKTNAFCIDNNEQKYSNKKINNENNNIDKLALGVIKINDVYNKRNSEEKKISNKDRVINNMQNNTIKNDFIELLNIITIYNYEIILNNISNLILNNNMIKINNISELLKNQNEFIEILINKAMKERKYIKLYSILCKDLFVSLMSVINNYNDEIDIFDKISNDKSLKYILKNKIMEKLNKFEFTPDSSVKYKNNYEDDPFYCDLKLKFTGIIYFVGELFEMKLISQKTGFEILDILYKRYINGNNNKKINIYNDLNLEGIEILLKNMKIIIYEKNNPEHVQRYNKFVKNYLNNIFKNRKNDLKQYLYYKLYNIIENQKNEEEIKNLQKVKTFVNNKNKNFFAQLNDFSDDKNEYFKLINKNNNNNSFTILEKKYNFVNSGNNNPLQSKENKDNFIMEIIKKDVEKFIIDINENKSESLEEINKKYNEEINIKKNIDIWEIFYYYIEVCIDIINSKEKIYIVNKYIENIINNFAVNLPNENWEMLHYKLISLFLNINEICSDNIYMHQIMGYLLFLLINNKLFFIKDLNNFLNKDNQIIIDIAKVVKYTIIFADKDAKKYHNDFKQTKLFIGNENFYNIVTLPLMKKYF